MAYLFVFFLCINFGLWFIGSSLDLDSIKGMSIDFQAQNITLQNQINTFESGGGFDLDLIFGDFRKAINVFMQMISGGYVVNTLTSLGFPEDFTLPMRVVIGFMTIGSLIYLVSGRA